MLMSFALSLLVLQAGASVDQSTFTAEQQSIIAELESLNTHKYITEQDTQKMVELFNTLSSSARSVNELMLFTSLTLLQDSALVLAPYQLYAINKLLLKKLIVYIKLFLSLLKMEQMHI